MNALFSSTQKRAGFSSSLNFSPLRKYQLLILVSDACQAGARSVPITKSLLRINFTSMASTSVSALAKDYSNWSPEKLIERVLFLEQQLREQTARYVYEQSSSR